MLLAIYALTKMPRQRILGPLRVMAYGIAVSLVLGALMVHTAVADAEDESLQVGRQLAGLSDLVAGANEFRLNGQPIYFSSTASADSVTTVLDRFEASCEKSPAFRPMDWKSFGDVKGTPVVDPAHGMSRLGIMRKEDPVAGDGMVLCFVGDRTPKNLLDALRAFEVSGDVHDLGDVRYVHAERRVNPSSPRPTLVQTMWTNGSFDLRAIAADPSRDAPGSDFATLPRPIRSVRRFTAEAVHTPYSARVYETSASPDDVLTDYKAKMEQAGWLSIRSPQTYPGVDEQGLMFVRVQTAEQAAVAARRDGSKTLVVVGSMGGASGKTPKSLTREP